MSPLGRARRWKRSVRFGMLTVLLSAIGRMPVHAARRFGRAVGGSVYHLAPGLRRRAHRHLSLALPTLAAGERRRRARAAFAWVGSATVDLRLAEVHGPTPVLEPLEVEGEEHWARAASSGRGLVACSAHCGNWELLGAAIARRGRKVSVLARPPREPRLAERLEAMRRRLGFEPLSVEGGLRPAVRALRRGGILGVLLDPPPHGRVTEAEFFGRARPVSLAPARLAALGRAPILPMALWGAGSGGYRLCFFDPLEPSSDLDDRVLVERTRRLARVLERMASLVPEQWPWFEDPWRIPRGVEWVDA